MDVAEPAHPRPELLPALSPSDEVPVSFGSSPMTTSTAAPARNPVTTAFERNCAIQPSFNAASRRNSSPVTSVIAATSWAAWSPPRPGHEHRSAGDRRKRRARAGRDLPRRAEQRVDERSRRRRVEPVLERHPGDARVAEVLRHDQRRHRDPGRDVTAQPAPLVPRQPLDDRQKAPHPHDPLTRGQARLTSRSSATEERKRTVPCASDAPEGQRGYVQSKWVIRLSTDRKRGIMKDHVAVAEIQSMQHPLVCGKR